MRLKHYLIFLLSVTAMLTLLTWYLFFKGTDKEKIRLEFVERSSFKVGEAIDPLSLIKTASTTNIIYPKIDIAAPGEKQLLYIAVDENGAQKEFLKTINIYSPQPPVIKLKQVAVSVYTGENFNPSDYVKDAYDKYDGKLQVKVSGNYNLKQSGVYSIIYTVENSGKLKSKAELKLTVKEKEQPIKKPENVPVTGTNKKPHKPQKPSINRRIWKFRDGYDFNSAKAACMKEAEALNVRYTCDVLYEGNIAVGYQLIY